MADRILAFFQTYAQMFNAGLSGEVDAGAAAALYAPAFVAASPQGIVAGENDRSFGEAMLQGYARYRDSGMTRMRLADVRVAPVDELHCMAHVGWSATYRRGDDDLAVDFQVHYLVQTLPGAEPRVFGWIAGDEQAVLEAHGLGPA